MDQYDYKGKSYPVWLNQKGYACITANEKGYGKAFLLHKLVWEQANGPVPMGHEIHHLDHDRANWRLDNLMAVDRPTHQAMHRQARAAKDRSTEYSHKPGKDKEKNLNPNRRERT
jgi:hypothetical protein